MPLEAAHRKQAGYFYVGAPRSDETLARAQEQADGHYRLPFLFRVDIEARAGPPSVWLRS